MDSNVKYGQETGRNLIKIGKRLINNQNLLMLLINTDKDPLNKEKHPNEINGVSVLNKNILFVPLLKPDKQDTTSKVAIFTDGGTINGLNSDNENLSLVINVYCPFIEWAITGDNLRPFAIMSEIRQSLQDRRINGLGEIKYLGFDLNGLTEEMSCYSMRFAINAFS